jgi:hypothetical protein
MALRRGARPESNDLGQWSIEASDAINALQIGQSENVFEGTLRASQTTSTFKFPGIVKGSAVLAIPMTSNAAGALSGMYQSAVETGEVTFTHANTAAADKTFRFVVFGSKPPQERTAS